MTLLLFTALNAKIIRTNRMDIIRCTFNRVCFAFCASSFSTPRMSMQNEVVKAVSAESALLKAAAMIPIVKNIRMLSPKMPDVQNIGRMSSPNVGKLMSCCVAKDSNKIPNDRNRKFTGVKANPYVYIFFCASLRFLQDRFFCIMS